MKRLVLLLLTAALVLSLTACTGGSQQVSGGSSGGEGQAADKNAPAPPADDIERELLYIFLDGQSLKEAGYSYSDIKEVMIGRNIDGTYYYGASVANITGEDLSSVKGAFLEAIDGYVSYISDVDNLYLAAFSGKDGQYQSVVLDDRHVYGGAAAGKSFNKGVVNVYLVTTPAEFSVEIQRNGEKVGQLTMDDFMRKTQVGEDRVATGLFDGSFLYQGGAATYEGRFLGIDFNTMLAKLNGMDMDLSGTITEVEYYGTNGLGKEGKNEEYSKSEGDSKYFGSVDFFCMFDGMTYNNITSDCPIGLTAFINGTGGRWMTYSLTAINFVIE
ncbi:MAG: hypothetical protein GX114_09470 [Clostridiales bacterium]|jgi:hypothetical protein|nr:hypothetical protein [Clostridiales bacterium]